MSRNPRPRVIAIDWSGRRGPDQKRAIWLAEADFGRLERLESGRTRQEVTEHLIGESLRDPDLIVGLDFAFSLPAWYLLEQGLTARGLWNLLAEDALTPAMRHVGLANWMNEPEPPFWTTATAHQLLAPHQKFRRTEREVSGRSSQPKSVFQLVGAGQVGRGSLYGMQALQQLSRAGYKIWPFDPPGRPMAIEIFPRLLTGPVRKSSAAEREQYVEGLSLTSDQHRLAASSEDAFDAAVSALSMASAVEELAALEPEPEYQLEGKIWRPQEHVSPEPALQSVLHAEDDLGAALAGIIDRAVSDGESARSQAERVLAELHRRGLLRRAP